MPQRPTPASARGGSRRGVVVVLVLLAALVGAVLAAPFMRSVGDWVEAAGAPCGVVVDGQRVPLDRDQSRAATAEAARSLGGPGAGDGAAVSELPEGVVEAVLAARADTALTCRVPVAEPAVEAETGSGLTPRAQAVLDAVRAEVGDLPVGGFAPGGVDSGHGEESTHYEGRAVDYFFRPVTEDHLDDGWVLSQWLVAHADELTVQYVIFDDHYWGVRGSARGWQDYRAPGGSDDPVLRHRDHVHVDVLRGE
ncbi:hypothetical protein [uncultured Serinicoccus sp.]|uniref:hypothetical protein n=1 Tax=uncultured Serinicoccus sp. TaxID=735514 RepID=UPI00260352C8|nr:hypothetical protein [uncultured Serinicoccus sp.]